MFSKYYAFLVSYSCIVSKLCCFLSTGIMFICLLSCLLCCRSFLLYRFVDDVALNHGHIELGVFLQEVVLLILDSRDFSTVAPFPKFGWGGTKATDMIWCVDRGCFLHSCSLHVNFWNLKVKLICVARWAEVIAKRRWADLRAFSIRAASIYLVKVLPVVHWVDSYCNALLVCDTLLAVITKLFLNLLE